MGEEKAPNERNFWPIGTKIKYGNRIFPHEDLDEYLES